MWTDAAKAEAMKSLLHPVFQPIVDSEGRLYAYEALMRFAGEGPQSSPLARIEYWEKTGYIAVLDRAMIASVTAAAKASAVRRRFAVNVSITTVENDGAAYLSDLQSLAVHAHEIIVELTETAPMQSAREVIRFAAACKAEGHLVALDDCSPHHPYSTPDFLRQIRPQLVKIDGKFLKESFTSGDSAALRSFVAASRSVGACVIAEHIENEELRNFALSLGASYLQGYGVGLPAKLPHAEQQEATLGKA